MKVKFFMGNKTSIKQFIVPFNSLLLSFVERKSLGYKIKFFSYFFQIKLSVDISLVVVIIIITKAQ